MMGIFACSHGSSRRLRSFHSHVFSFIPGFVNPRWSENGGPHAHSQLREKGQIRTAQRKTYHCWEEYDVCLVELWHPPTQPQSKTMFCIFFESEMCPVNQNPTRSCRDKSKTNLKLKHFRFILSLWNGKQCCHLHATNLTNAR